MLIIKQIQDNCRDHNKIIGTASDSGKLLKDDIIQPGSTWNGFMVMKEERKSLTLYRETKQDVKCRDLETKGPKTALKVF
jgi:hypothetical protein